MEIQDLQILGPDLKHAGHRFSLSCACLAGVRQQRGDQLQNRSFDNATDHCKSVRAVGDATAVGRAVRQAGCNSVHTGQSTFHALTSHWPPFFGVLCFWQQQRPTERLLLTDMHITEWRSPSCVQSAWTIVHICTCVISTCAAGPASAHAHLDYVQCYLCCPSPALRLRGMSCRRKAFLPKLQVESTSRGEQTHTHCCCWLLHIMMIMMTQHSN